MYTAHLRQIVRKRCESCSQTFCYACGERVSASRDQNGKLTIDESPLFHCANMQGVILGVGLLILEQSFAVQIGDASFADRSAGNSKKRKVSTPSTPVTEQDDDDDMAFYGTHSMPLKGKKTKAIGVGYAGNQREDVRHCSHSLGLSALLTFLYRTLDSSKHLQSKRRRTRRLEPSSRMSENSYLIFTERMGGRRATTYRIRRPWHTYAGNSTTSVVRFCSSVISSTTTSIGFGPSRPLVAAVA